MEYTNLLFLYLFFPAAVLIYYLLPDIRKKNLSLLFFSLMFYGLGQPLYMVLLVLWSYLNHKLTLRIVPDDRATIILPVALNVCLLAVLLHLDFLLEMAGLQDGLLLGSQKNIVRLLNSVGFTLREPDSLLPIGISFYVISVISYQMDVYLDKIDPEQKFSSLLLYLMMFPKLFMGPIVRYEDVSDQLENRRHNPRAAFEGLRRFLFGLAKKVLLADYCGRLLAQVNGSGADTTLVGVWFSGILFMFQIYYAFSGYSDMAIGLGRVFGFRFRENFRRPYLALSVKEFWNRWHLSLNSFFWDYVYVPLGADVQGKSRQIFNLLVVCVLTGLWYGAGWNFLIWGLYFFAVLVIEDQFIGAMENLPDWVGRCLTLWLVLFGWIIFSNGSLPELQAAFLAILGYGKFAKPELWTWIVNSLPMLFVCVLGCTQFPVTVKQVFDGICGMGRRWGKVDRITPLGIVHAAVSLGVMALLLWACAVSLAHFPDAPVFFGNF